MALRFEQDSSIFRIDDIYTFIITYFFSGRKKEKGLVHVALRIEIKYFLWQQFRLFWLHCSRLTDLHNSRTLQVYIIQGHFLSVPVNRSKCVEVLHHDAVQISESIKFPEIVQVGHPILPQSWNLIERPDKAAVVRVRLSDHWNCAAAASAHICRCWRFHPGQRQHDWAAPHTPPCHPD